MDLAGLTLDDWDTLNAADQARIARQIEARASVPLRFAGAQLFDLAGIRHRVALFEHAGATFTFVPGGAVELGYDLVRFEPTPEQLESYRSSAESYGLPEDPRLFLARVLTPLRTATVPPMLIEASAREVGLEPVAADDPEVREALRKYGRVPGTLEINRKLRVERRPDGSIKAFRITPVSHAQLGARLAEAGARLPTSDEWEYACGGGSRSLFRWGDHCPCDRYPTDHTAAQVRRHGDDIAGRAAFQPDEPDWVLHRLPNALGLHIAEDPYHWEAVAEPGLWRGGDGGSNICGGAGFFLGWVPLATAYLDPTLTELAQGGLTNAFARRVIPLT